MFVVGEAYILKSSLLVFVAISRIVAKKIVFKPRF